MDNIEIIAMLDEARFLKNQLDEPKKAIKICNDILIVEPKNKDAMLIKAGALNEIFELDEAELLIQQIILCYPHHWEAYYLYALNFCSRNENVKGLDMIEKSIELNENFDNVISKAQILKFMGRSEYTEYLEKAKKINRGRAENFMKNHWVNNIDEVKPTFQELLNAIKHLIKKKIQ